MYIFGRISPDQIKSQIKCSFILLVVSIEFVNYLLELLMFSDNCSLFLCRAYNPRHITADITIVINITTVVKSFGDPKSSIFGFNNLAFTR